MSVLRVDLTWNDPIGSTYSHSCTLQQDRLSILVNGNNIMHVNRVTVSGSHAFCTMSPRDQPCAFYPL